MKASVSLPRVSVLMPTYNGAAHIEESIRSILRQTLSDFELIIVDDCSTDTTPDRIKSIAAHEPRIRIFENRVNVGVVAARNIAFTNARAPYIASLDHDDLSLPHRLARQVGVLDQKAETVLVCSDARRLSNGRVGDRLSTGRLHHEVLRWWLYLSNPITQSTIMFRKQAVQALGAFMRAGYEYADDFDLYHRLLTKGRIEGIDEPLTLYRLHDRNASSRYKTEMARNACRVLENAYSPLLGEDAGWAAGLISRLVAEKEAPSGREEVARLGAALTLLYQRYCAVYRIGDTDRSRLAAIAGRLYEEAVARGISRGRLNLLPAPIFKRSVSFATGLSGALIRRGRAIVSPAIPKQFKEQGRRPLRCGSASRLLGTTLNPAALPEGMAPTLCVVIDTEAEFDWDVPFSRDQTSVENVQEQWRAQEIFDRYGLRPVYVVDYPVATNDEACRTLRSFIDNGRCAIGAHLQPWTTPPFEEELTEGNSYPGNLPPALERAKLRSLNNAIKAQFGRQTAYFKAGRYGLGAATYPTLLDEGFTIDLSIMPGADYRGTGGPDYRQVDSIPYTASIAGQSIFAVPMTRSHSGSLAEFGTILDHRLAALAFRPLHLRGLLARLRLFNAVPLTPEGVPERESIQLIRSMLTRGYRFFVLHYHSSSLLPGFTPYARDRDGRDQVVQRIANILAYFFDDRGGMPGMPSDLLPDWAAYPPLAAEPVAKGEAYV
jgi:glycosyltransferase involved in cell wall biosynthesis